MQAYLEIEFPCVIVSAFERYKSPINKNFYEESRESWRIKSFIAINGWNG